MKSNLEERRLRGKKTTEIDVNGIAKS